jgi:predicted transcriptional regulator
MFTLYRKGNKLPILTLLLPIKSIKENFLKLQEIPLSMDISILEDLGLTNSEIKVYMALLRLGNANSVQTIDASGLQSSVVFRALTSLIEKGLLNYILEGRRKIYQATDPKNFINFIDDKKRRFEKILPELQKEQNISKNKEVATVYKGIRGIKEIYAIMRETKGKEYNSFGGGKPCEDLLGADWWKNHHLKRIDLKLTARQVFDETVREAGKWNNTQPFSKVRFMSKEFEQLQETTIVGDKVSICVFTQNSYGFLIHDKVVADGYRKQFELLWKSAKKA